MSPRVYNDQAETELVIHELKTADAPDKIPSRRRDANEASFLPVCSPIALLNRFRRLCVPPPWQRWPLCALRNRLLLVSGTLVRPQGTSTLKLPEPFPHQTAL